MRTNHVNFHSNLNINKHNYFFFELKEKKQKKWIEVNLYAILRLVSIDVYVLYSCYAQLIYDFFLFDRSCLHTHTDTKMELEIEKY